MMPRPPISTLFPYTTLFRSSGIAAIRCTASSRSIQFSECSLRVKSVMTDCKLHSENWMRSEEHTSELQSHHDLVCRLLLEKKKHINTIFIFLIYSFLVIIET